nr:MAG TPA: hypothetical protein [Caudoviricetes sp.]
MFFIENSYIRRHKNKYQAAFMVASIFYFLLLSFFRSNNDAKIQ